MDVFAPDALKGKVAVVAGAARGIGRCAAVALAQAGASVAGLDICTVASAIDTFPPATRGDLDQTWRVSYVEAAGDQLLITVCGVRGAIMDAPMTYSLTRIRTDFWGAG